jgi:biofilm PGA synthesis N-glycosyltransferase PgaC
MSGPPIFYDKSGKRLPRVALSVFLLLLLIGGAGAILLPSVFSPVRGAHSDEGWARRTLGEHDNLPLVGDQDHGIFTRLVRVEREHTGSGAPPGPDPALLQPIPAPDYDGDGIPDDLDGDGVPDMVMPEPPAPPPPPPVRLVDAVTGEFIRNANDYEVQTIGSNAFAVDRYGSVPGRTLILTFDDGPDPVWTREVLDVLAREHVPATFFVVGQNVANHPELVQRMIREGHMVGNHTMTHPETFDAHSDFQNQQEINLTDRVLRAVAGYASPIFRIPTGQPEVNSLAQLESQQLGYLQVLFDTDSHDWEFDAQGREVPVPQLDGNGHVVIMHDAGGRSRAGTVAMLEKLIHEAKAQGYKFATAGYILPQRDLPRHVTPSFSDRATLFFIQTVHVLPRKALTAVFWFGVGSMLILTGLYLILSVINEWRQRRKAWPDTPEDELPFVSVCLAAYNEEKVITRTLDMLRESDYPANRFEVIAVNDGSKDDTLSLLQAYDWPQLKVVDQRNAGKSTALNNAVRHADPRSSVIMTMDADTLFRKDTIRKLARHFITGVHGGKIVGAVAGHVKVGNRNNILTAWQSLEYLNGICIIRMAEMMVGAVGIVPGACSAWRRVALERIGGFSEDTLAEDADAAMTFQRLGYAVLHENHAICDTEAPETVVPLLKQRKRWMFGNFQVMWKNKAMLFRPSYGVLGMVTMPYSVAQLLMNLLFLPILLVVAGITAAQGDWHPIVAFALVVLVMHTIIAITAVAIAKESLVHLLVVPLYRPIYELMRVYLLYACLYRVLKGAEFSWDKLERLNTVAIAGR